MLFPVKKLPSINSADHYLVSSTQTLEVSATSSCPQLLKYQNLAETSVFTSQCYLVEHCRGGAQPTDELGSDLYYVNKDFCARVLDYSDMEESDSANDLESLYRFGITGIVNVENSCFLNSVIQCLRCTNPLVAYVFHKIYKRDIAHDSSHLVSAFFNLVKQLWFSPFGTSPLYPESFLRALQDYVPEFNGHSQQDAHEFLLSLLTGLHERMNRGKSKQHLHYNNSVAPKAKAHWNNYLKQEDSELVRWFVGQLQSTLICTHCHHISATFEPFWDISLPIPTSSNHPTTIEECLHACFNDERIEGSNMPFCNSCKMHQTCYKRMSILKFPEILTIHLKRFTDEQKKLDTMVVYPVDNLDLFPFLSADAFSGPARYHLYAVVNHHGTLNYGHYTAYCQHPFSKVWYEFNDHRVYQLESPDNVVTDKAYILFYELENHSSRL